MRSENHFSALGLFFLCALFSCTSARAATLVENFTTLDHADLSSSTGVWNTVTHQAQAGAVDNGSPSTSLSFGDGSDGVLDTSSGYTFDTDSHPNGYNFISVNITGGTITVLGSNPLIIRSLTTVNITPTIDVSGGSGTSGQASTGNPGPAYGAATAAIVRGGVGGAAFSTATASNLNGGNGENSDGTFYTNSTGTGSITSGTAGGRGQASTNVPSNFDNGFVIGGFASGTGGGGGGGYWVSNADAATGGGGGGGGGAVHIVAVGAVSVGTINANGGNGGAGATSTLATKCSGPGAGGDGGAVWIQSLVSVSGPAPLINGGSGGTPAGGFGCSSTTGGFGGLARADAPSGPGWGTGNTDPTNAATLSTYVVQSTAYDLGTSNAFFSSNPTITSQANGGTISVKYAGSDDGQTFWPPGFTSTISDLSNQHFRYLKFQISITTAGAAGPSPAVTSISIPYNGPSLDNVDLNLAAGCGGLQILPSGNGSGAGSDSSKGLMMTALWCLFYLGLWRFVRRSSERAPLS